MAKEKPEFCNLEYLVFLDELRESGETNMYGARPYLMEEYPELTKQQAGEVLLYWMDSFSERHSNYPPSGGKAKR